MFFKKKEEIEKYYKLGRVLGQGSFATGQKYIYVYVIASNLTVKIQ